MDAARRLPPFGRSFLAFVRATPLSRGQARRIILNAMKKRINHPVLTDFRGIPFIFNMDNSTEAKALFGYYNIEELAFLKKNTSHESAVFVDLGGNSGFFTQNFLAANNTGTALTIEPNPQMCERIQANYNLIPENERGTLILETVAVGDVRDEMALDLSSGFGSAHIVEHQTDNTITVSIDLLSNIVAKDGIEYIDVLKIDVEGFEDKALIPFFKTVDQALFPKHIIIEHTSDDNWDGDLYGVLEKAGYTTVEKTRGNLLMSRQNCRKNETISSY